MAFDLKGASPDTTLPSTGFLFGADSQSATDPSIYSMQALRDAILGSAAGVNGATVTTDAPLLNLSQTWNAAGVTFTGWKFNVTDTASAAASALIDLQVGGSRKFSVSKTGTVELASEQAVGTATNRVVFSNGGVGLYFYRAGNTFPAMTYDASGMSVGSNLSVCWSNSSDRASSAKDLLLSRAAAGVVRVRGASSAAGTVSLGTQTVANLPAAATAGAGSIAFVSDATATTVRSTVAGGGANFVMVMSDGTNWLIAA